MPNIESSNRFEYLENKMNPADEKSVSEQDNMMEEILQNLNNTPIGQVLSKIASLPEIRTDKVLGVREQLTNGKYDVNNRLDIALDRVLEDLTAQ